MKTTLDEVARTAGVSTATVSRVLNGHANVSKVTREIVIKAAHKCRYESSWHVSAHPTIAIITDHLRFIGYFSEILAYIEEALLKHEFQMEIITLNNIDLLASRQINGAIILPSRSISSDHCDKFSPMPLVCINSSPPKMSDICSVNSNLEQGIHLAVEHLFELGHRKICLQLEAVYSQLNWGDSSRMRGFENAVRHFGIEDQTFCSYIREHQSLLDSMAVALQNGATAFICSAYGLALEAYQALQLLGCRIPDDVSLIVREEWDVTPYLLPRPTFLRLPLRNLANSAVDMLIAQIKGQSCRSVSDIDYTIVPGMTTAAPPDESYIRRREKLLGAQKFT